MAVGFFAALVVTAALLALQAWYKALFETWQKLWLYWERNRQEELKTSDPWCEKSFRPRDKKWKPPKS